MWFPRPEGPHGATDGWHFACDLKPLQGSSLGGTRFPGLKPWTESYGPFGFGARVAGIYIFELLFSVQVASKLADQVLRQQRCCSVMRRDDRAQAASGIQDDLSVGAP